MELVYKNFEVEQMHDGTYVASAWVIEKDREYRLLLSGEDENYVRDTILKFLNQEV